MKVENVEVNVPLDDGARTTLERWGERGPVMLCVHGMTSSRKSWERLASRYSDRYRVFAYDQRGHGDSAGVGGPMTLHRSLADLYCVMDAIGEPVELLLGHSWGGAIALLGGERFDVARVAAIDPMIRQATPQWYAEFIEDVREIFALHGIERDEKVRVEYAAWPPIDRERKVHAVHAMTLDPIAALRDENAPETWDLRRDLVNYPKPLLLAMAEPGESIVTPEDLAYVRGHAGSNATIRVFDGQGHNLHRIDFDRFAEVLDAFCERSIRPGPGVEA